VSGHLWSTTESVATGVEALTHFWASLCRGVGADGEQRCPTPTPWRHDLGAATCVHEQQRHGLDGDPDGSSGAALDSRIRHGQPKLKEYHEYVDGDGIAESETAAKRRWQNQPRSTSSSPGKIDSPFLRVRVYLKFILICLGLEKMKRA
jgi:hypothetical protein